MRVTAATIASILVCSALLALPAGARAQQIRIVDFDVSYPAGGKVRLMLQAECKGIELGSYCIRLTDRPEKPVPPGFALHSNGYEYLRDGQMGLPVPNLAENGPLDEDPRENVFAITLDTALWPPGKYLLSVSAHNRPAAGDYVQDHRLVAVTVGPTSGEPAPVGNVPGAEHRVVYQKPGVYACFPSLCETPDGRLITSFGTRTRRSHIDNTGGSLSLSSGDGGVTWSPVDQPRIDRRWQTADGRLVTARAEGWIYTDADRLEELKAKGKTTMHARDGVVAYLGGAKSRVSQDGGKTWSEHDIDVPQYVSGLMTYHQAASELVAPDGLRLVAVYGRRIAKDNPDDPARQEIFVLRSTDDGRTWQCRAMFPQGPPDPGRGFNETALVRTGDGRILAMMRTAPEGTLYQSFSSDGGLTWSWPSDSRIWGYPAHLLLLDDGRLLCTYGYRKKPMGIRACLSTDHGRTWQIDRELILRDDGFGSPSDLGYPLTHLLPNGRLLTIYYLTVDGANTHVATTHWVSPE